MATKIRLQRFGRRGYPFYRIVIADSRAPRDGKFIERIGSYNPNTNPATIDLKFDRALYWLKVGAQPSDTVRRILSREGVLLKKHLDGGVAKGAFTQEVADQRFESWLTNKQQLLKGVAERDQQKAHDIAQKQHEAEEEQNKERSKALEEKKAAIEREKAEAEAAAKAEAEAAEEAQLPRRHPPLRKHQLPKRLPLLSKLTATQPLRHIESYLP